MPGLYYDDSDIRQIRFGCTASSFTLNPVIDMPVPFSKYQVEQIPYTSRLFTSGTNVFATLYDDIFSPVLDLPFNFNFYENSYNQLVVSSNGYISFNTQYATQISGYNMPNVPLPNPSLTAIFRNAIFGVMEDIFPSSSTNGGMIKWNITGTEPNRNFVLSYYNVPLNQCSSLLQSYQIILYESSNIIEVNVLRRNRCDMWNAGRGLIGVTNSNGSKATVAPARNINNIWSTINNGVNTPEAWRFTPDREITMQWYKGAGFSGELLSTDQNYTINRGESPLDTVTVRLQHADTGVDIADTVVIVWGKLTNLYDTVSLPFPNFYYDDYFDEEPAAGNYVFTRTITTEQNCDSTVILHLAVLPETPFDVNLSYFENMEGITVSWNGAPVLSAPQSQRSPLNDQSQEFEVYRNNERIAVVSENFYTDMNYFVGENCYKIIAVENEMKSVASEQVCAVITKIDEVLKIQFQFFQIPQLRN